MEAEKAFSCPPTPAGVPLLFCGNDSRRLFRGARNYKGRCAPFHADNRHLCKDSLDPSSRDRASRGPSFKPAQGRVPGWLWGGQPTASRAATERRVVEISFFTVLGDVFFTTVFKHRAFYIFTQTLVSESKF